MKVIKTVLLGLVLLCSTLTYAQSDQTIFGSQGIGLTGMWGGSNYIFTNFSPSYASEKGGFFELEFNKHILVGWKNIKGTYDATEYEDLDYKTNGFTLGYSPIAQRSFHPVFNIYGGFGRIQLPENQRTNIQIWQPSVDVEFNIFKWVKLGLNVGYRFTNLSEDPTNISKKLTSPYAGLKMKFGWSWGK